MGETWLGETAEIEAMYYWAEVAWAECRRAIKRDLRRAALLRCMTPLDTALSSSEMAARIASSVVGSAAFVAMALRAEVTYVRTVDLTDRLRARRFSSWRMRFLADEMFGMGDDFLLIWLGANARGHSAYLCMPPRSRAARRRGPYGDSTPQSELVYQIARQAASPAMMPAPGDHPSHQ